MQPRTPLSDQRLRLVKLDMLEQGRERRCRRSAQILIRNDQHRCPQVGMVFQLPVEGPIDVGPEPCPTTDLLACTPQLDNRLHTGVIAHVERPSVGAKLQVTDGIEIPDAAGISASCCRKDSLLFQQRRDVLAGMTNRHDELRIGKQFQQILYPGEVVVSFGRVSNGAAHSSNFFKWLT